HVHLVEDVDLAPAGCADTEVHTLDQFANRFDPVVRRGVQFDEVVERSRVHGFAVLAHAARLARRVEAEAIERAGKDARGRGLAGAARSREEICVADAVFFYRVPQRGGDVFLADQLRKTARPVLAVEAL